MALEEPPMLLCGGARMHIPDGKFRSQGAYIAGKACPNVECWHAPACCQVDSSRSQALLERHAAGGTGGEPSQGASDDQMGWEKRGRGGGGGWNRQYSAAQ